MFMEVYDFVRHGDACKHPHAYVAIGSDNSLALQMHYIDYPLPILTYGQREPSDNASDSIE